MIKELNKKYLNDIIKLHKRAMIPLWRKLKKTYSSQRVGRYVSDTLRKGKVFGYFLDGKLIGCAGIAIDKKLGAGEIRHVSVEPKFQKRGIGRKLMNFLEKYAKRKVKKISLDVLIKSPAVKFYEKLGWKKHAYVMRKYLR